jgi:hypothetical protein
MTTTIRYRLMANPPLGKSGKRRRISQRWVQATFTCKSMAEAKRLDAYLKHMRAEAQQQGS